MGDTAAEMLAKEMQAIVAADRWKGRDLSAAPPEKWSHLRPETQQFWIDTAARILAALPAASAEAENATLRDHLARMEGALEFYRDAWKCKPNKRYGGLEWSPKEELLDDCGNTAKAALASIRAALTDGGSNG